MCTGPVGGRGNSPNNLMIDFGPNGSKSPGNGRILITKYAKYIFPQVFWTPIFDQNPNYRGK